MPPRSSNNGTLPATLTCRVCGEGKPPAAYSKSQIQKWYNLKRNDRANLITPENAGLSCMEHSNVERRMPCHGPCNLVKAVESFSKNQRNSTDPWCIVCTEWRLGFNGNEVPTPIPNAPLTYGEYGSAIDNGKPTSSSLLSSQDEEDDDDDYSDDEDESDIRPYDGPTAISSLIDRLEGYGGLSETSENITTDAMSTMNSVKISLWDESDAGGNDSGSENSADTVTGIQPSTMRSSVTLIDAPMIPNPGQHGSNSRSYTPATNSSATPSAFSTPAGVAPHLNRLASGPNMNYQIHNTQASRFTDSGEGTQSMPNRIVPGRLPLGRKSEGGIESSALHLVDGVPLASSANGWRPSTKTQSVKGSKNRWYKGDNRKVFTSRRKYLPDANQDQTEEPYGSDSPDEM
ncbi:hypothetical protein F5X97DRAFT_329042 [Nemania serpens]|nr:hypothetical protein F5X97DRAFT_329042 [Nemania serpens]